jgi:hypothetical protein
MERPARGECHRSRAAVTQMNSGRLGNLYGRGRLPGRRRCAEPDISAAASEGTAGVDCSLDLTNALVIPHPDVPPWRQRRVVVPDRIRGSSPSASVPSRRAPPASLGPTASAAVHRLFCRLNPATALGGARSTVRDSLDSSCLPSPADNNEPPYKKNRPLDKAIKSCSQPLPYSLDLIVIKK